MKTFFPKTFLGLDVTSRERYRQHIEWLEAEFDRLSKENRELRIGIVDRDREMRQLRQQIAHTGVYRGEDGRIYSNKKKTS
ncbi:MAG: hypothetical protein IJ998_00405 [Alistipes sp.]|nr:hypothetical protein [Alistipes sp.]